MKRETLSFDQLPAAVYQLCQEVSELKRLLAEQSSNTNDLSENKPIGVADAADFMGVSKQTVYQNIDKIPHKKRFGRLYFFRPQLTEYINAGGQNA